MKLFINRPFLLLTIIICSGVLSVFCLILIAVMSNFLVNDFDAYWGPQELRDKHVRQQKVMSSLLYLSAGFAIVTGITGIIGIIFD